MIEEVLLVALPSLAVGGFLAWFFLLRSRHGWTDTFEARMRDVAGGVKTAVDTASDTAAAMAATVQRSAAQAADVAVDQAEHLRDAASAVRG